MYTCTPVVQITCAFALLMNVMGRPRFLVNSESMYFPWHFKNMLKFSFKANKLSVHRKKLNFQFCFKLSN